MEKYFEDIKSRVKILFGAENSGHDLYHLTRVFNLALHLQKLEGGDRLVIGGAALLHDVHRLLEREVGMYCVPRDSLPTVEKILREVGFPRKKISDVLHCIEYHEEYPFSERGRTVGDPETLILQDADNLDAIGAIGIGRTFTFGGAHGLSMWVPDQPFDRETFDESSYDLSIIHHFHSKLLKLSSTMNTKTAQGMARERHEYMERFVERFIKEWQGEM